MDFGLASDLVSVLATGVGLKLKVTEDLDLEKVLGTDSFRIFEQERGGDTWEVGNEGGVYKVEFGEMELRFTIPFLENPDHYLYFHINNLHYYYYCCY